MYQKKVPRAVTLDAWLLLCGIAAAGFIVESGYIPAAAQTLAQHGYFASFSSGILFTSVLTTAPSVALFVELAPYIPAWKLALIGAFGAVVGDLLIFRFVHSGFVSYIVRACTVPRMRRLGKKLDGGPFWWVVPLLGALVIASPLPDELGLLMMGLSHLKLPAFLALSFVMNAIGIFAIVLAAQSLAL